MSWPALSDLGILAEGLDHPEGVAVGPTGHIYAGGEAGQVYRIAPDGQVEDLATTGGFILGLCLDADANVYACDMRLGAVMRITPEGQVGVHARGPQGRRFLNPNYPVFDGQGNLFVSDSGEWMRDNGFVARVTPDGRVSVWSDAVRAFPNGLALAPDGDGLAVVETTARRITWVPILPGGEAGTPRVLAQVPDTVPDGIAYDVEGNLYVGCYRPDAIYRVSSAGKVQLLLVDPWGTTMAAPTNLAFGGAGNSRLYIASLGRWHVAYLDMPVPGPAMVRPRLRRAGPDETPGESSRRESA